MPKAASKAKSLLKSCMQEIHLNFIGLVMEAFMRVKTFAVSIGLYQEDAKCIRKMEATVLRKKEQFHAKMYVAAKLHNIDAQ